MPPALDPSPRRPAGCDAVNRESRTTPRCDRRAQPEGPRCRRGIGGGRRRLAVRGTTGGVSADLPPPLWASATLAVPMQVALHDDIGERPGSGPACCGSVRRRPSSPAAIVRDGPMDSSAARLAAVVAGGGPRRRQNAATSVVGSGGSGRLARGASVDVAAAQPGLDGDAVGLELGNGAVLGVRGHRDLLTGGHERSIAGHLRQR